MAVRQKSSGLPENEKWPLPSQRYDRTAAIRLQKSMPVRPTTSNCYDPNPANFMTPIKSVTPRRQRHRLLHASPRYELPRRHARHHRIVKRPSPHGKKSTGVVTLRRQCGRHSRGTVLQHRLRCQCGQAILREYNNPPLTTTARAAHTTSARPFHENPKNARPRRQRTIRARLFGRELRRQPGQISKTPTTALRQKYDEKKVRNSEVHFGTHSNEYGGNQNGSVATFIPLR